MTEDKVAGADQRWASEQEFFDQEDYLKGPIPQNTIDRYVNLPHPFTPAEYPYAALGDVRGKRLFELGSGDGQRAVFLALRGATVVGVDISPRAVEVGTRLAQMHGVSDRVQFHAMPVEVYLKDVYPQTVSGASGGKFDVIYGFGILHHLIPVLDPILSDLTKLAHPQTVYMFTEPVALSQALRKLRLMLPIKVVGTPDERPLEPREFAILKKYLPPLDLRVGQFLLRPWSRFIGGRYEDYPGWKKAAYHSLCRLDSVILSIPGLKPLGCDATILARPAA